MCCPHAHRSFSSVHSLISVVLHSICPLFLNLSFIQASREVAYKLLTELCRGCPENLAEVWSYVVPQHESMAKVPSWDYNPEKHVRSITQVSLIVL